VIWRKTMVRLWKYKLDCGRMGNIDGVFLASDDEIKEVIGKTVYFGEALGKHSEVEAVIEEKELTEITSNQAVIFELHRSIEGNTLCGYNPVEYYADQIGE
jgi:hypothetical protein